MRPVPLTTLRGGINRLKVRGAARADMLYDLLNGYVTNAATIAPREGTTRDAVLDANTVGLMAMKGQKHVFSSALQTVPAGYVCDVLAHPAVQYTPPFPGLGLPGWTNTVPTLLHFEDGNGSTTFADSGANPVTWTSQGGAACSTTQARFGGGSLSVNSTTKFIRTVIQPGDPLDLITGQPDWTIEFWFYFATWPASTVGTLFDFANSNLSVFGRMYCQSDGIGTLNKINQVSFQTSGWGAGGVTVGFSNTILNNTWNHVALCRDGNKLRLYVNGAQAGQSFALSASFASITPAYSANAILTIGGSTQNFGTAIPYFIDEFRVTKGVCLYADTFTPPSTVLTSAANQPALYTLTSLLHFEDGANSTVFKDDATPGLWTPNGAAKEVATPVKLGVGSGQFLLNADYLTAIITAGDTSPTDLAYSKPDFTVEGFIYPLAVTGGADHYWWDFAHKTSATSDDAGFRIRSNNTNLFVRMWILGEVLVANNALPTAGQWYHIALVSRGAVVTLYVNGINVASFDAPATLGENPSTGAQWYLAGRASASVSADGYMDECRVIKGLAVYKGNFTPPTAPSTAPGFVSPMPKTIWFSKPFMGFPYVVAEFITGDVLHYWLQYNSTWAANTVEPIGTIVLPLTVQTGLAYQAVRDLPVQPVWSSETPIAAGAQVEPTVATGFYYRAVNVAGTSPHTGPTEPVWPTLIGATIQEFGDFGITSTPSQIAGSSTTAAPLGTTITDRYGNSQTISGQTGTTSSQVASVPASTVITTWAKGTLYSPGAVVRPTTSQGAFINAIPNGDFEAGDDGNWIKSAGAAINGAPAPYQGSFQGYLLCNHSVETLTMNTFGAVTPGQSVTASCYTKVNASGTDLTFNLKLRWYTSADVFISETVGPNIQGSSGWVKTSVTGSAPATAAHCRVQAYAANGTTARSAQVDLVVWNLETASAVSNFLFEAVQAAPGASGAVEPTWPVVAGNTVVDNQVTWKAIGTSIITWQAIPLMMTGSAEPIWPSLVGNTVVDGSSFTTTDAHVNNTSMSWIAISRQISDPKCPNSKAAALAATHVFAADNDIAPFSAAVNPTDWSTASNAGYLPTGLNNYGDNPVAVLALYRSNLMVFNSGGYQMWQVDPDPQNMALLDAQPVGSIYTRAAQSVANDLMFLAEVGVRNLSTVGATANMQIGSTGQQIDPLVVGQLQAGTYSPISLYYPGRGQYWLIFGPQAFVLTINGEKGTRSWSRYVFPDNITDWTLLNGSLYLRTAGNLVWRLDATALQDDVGGTPVNFNSAIQWPYLDYGTIGVGKMLIGVDLTGTGVVTIQVGFREDDTTTFSDDPGFATSLNVTAPYTINLADTVPGTPIPIPLDSPSYSLILKFGPNQAWTWQASSLYVQDNRGAGVTQ